MGSQKRGSAVSGVRALAAVVVLMCAAAVAAGLWLAGTPTQVRLQKFDEQRVNNLQTISSLIDNSYAQTSKLPASLVDVGAKYGKPSSDLNDLKPSSVEPAYMADPANKTPYAYVVTGASTYQLCATFDAATPSTDAAAEPVPYAPGIGYPTDWNHPAGYYCFTLNAEARLPRPSCGLRNPCAAGQTCTSLPNQEGAFCVPQGKECAAAGCPSNSCVVSESYPSSVTCTPPAK